jgi:hypothetical protein
LHVGQRPPGSEGTREQLINIFSRRAIYLSHWASSGMFEGEAVESW